MEAVRFWETGRDPFAPVKHEELGSSALWDGLDAVLAPENAKSRAEDFLSTLLALSLWGNRVDLSYAVGAAFGRTGASEDLLSDDRAWGARQLLFRRGNVHIVGDNTGSELSMDLVLADAVITRADAKVTIHLKAHPTFVSDATVADLWNLVAAMFEKGGQPRALAARLRTAFDAGRLRIVPDFFWNGPRFLWDRPARLAAEIDDATVVVMKGDANYRRAVGDALWAPETSLTEVTAYFPAPMLFLRTLKSDSVAGLTPGIAPKLDAVDPEWRINGRRGVIQRGGGSGRSGSGRAAVSYSK
jgi:Damage-control phosphatase ARMT1-like domain